MLYGMLACVSWIPLDWREYFCLPGVPLQAVQGSQLGVVRLTRLLAPLPSCLCLKFPSILEFFNWLCDFCIVRLRRGRLALRAHRSDRIVTPSLSALLTSFQLPKVVYYL